MQQPTLVDCHNISFSHRVGTHLGGTRQLMHPQILVALFVAEEALEAVHTYYDGIAVG
jgi:hypothetical protein